MSGGCGESNELVAALETVVGDARRGLPENVFLLVSRITPLVNVDLLIKDDQNRTLLTWRDDKIYGSGWHLPGGIIRFKETMAERVMAVARRELGADVTLDVAPLLVVETIDRAQETRGHMISFLYLCSLKSALSEELRYRGGVLAAGQWAWHASCPEQLIHAHRVYERFLRAVAPEAA